MHSNIFKDTLQFEAKRKNFVYKLADSGEKPQFLDCEMHIPTVFDGKSVQLDILNDLKK